MPRKAVTSASEKRSEIQARGGCACGAVRFEIDVPAVWAWHDHSPASRHAQGCAYATYVGSWKKRFRLLSGADLITRYVDDAAGATRSFCTRCGTPLFYERARSKSIVNIPRALFETRTGREPRYHVGLADRADWTWAGEPLTPLKGYPGVMVETQRRKRPAAFDL